MNSPTHEDVARRAHELWQKRGCPVGRDDQIWLAAERQLTAEAAHAASTPPHIVPGALHAAGAAITPEPHAGADMPPTSAVESHLAPPVSEGASLKAGLQRTEAREPIRQTKFAPGAAFARSARPLWTRTHAS